MNNCFFGWCKWAAFFVLIGGGLYSCKGSKKTTTTNEVVKELPKGLQPKDYLQQKIEYTAFSGKAAMHFEGKNQSQDFTANIKMRKDKDIWVSIVAMGGLIEAARAYITPDTLKAINKLQRHAYVLPYQEGTKLIDAELEFPALQSLLIGNVLIDDAPIKDIVESDSVLSFTCTKDEFDQRLTYNKRTGLLKEATLKSDKRKFSCQITYDKYAAITGKQPFAFYRTMAIDNKGEKINLTMDFGKAELNVPVEMPFTINNSYELQNLKKKK
jgi:hypothetical protein